MEPILIQQESAASAPTSLLRGNNVRTRKEYAWAPCNHVFVRMSRVFFSERHGIQTSLSIQIV